MTFHENELVTISWVDHSGRGRREHNKLVRFICYHGEKSCVVEVETPLGKERRIVLLAKIGRTG